MKSLLVDVSTVEYFPAMSVLQRFAPKDLVNLDALIYGYDTENYWEQ